MDEADDSPATYNPAWQNQAQQTQSFQPSAASKQEGRMQGTPPTRVSKTGKVQELVPVKLLKVPDPIRGMAGRNQFSVDQILKLPITMEIGQFLDKSDVSRQELALSMQRSTPRYRVKKPSKAKGVQASSSIAMAAMPQAYPPIVTAHAHEDDGQSQPLMTTAWVGGVKFEKTLLDGGSIVELVSGRKLRTMNPPPHIFTDGHLRVSLATDAVYTLTNYVQLPVNMQGVQAIVKAWVVDNQVYNLLLGVP